MSWTCTAPVTTCTSTPRGPRLTPASYVDTVTFGMQNATGTVALLASAFDVPMDSGWINVTGNPQPFVLSVAQNFGDRAHAAHQRYRSPLPFEQTSVLR